MNRIARLSSAVLLAWTVTTVQPGIAREISGSSIYQLNDMWRNESGKIAHFRALMGKPRVIAFFYSHCPYLCPRIVSDMKKIQQELDPAARKRVGFVLISIDPKDDSPSKLRKFAEKRNLNPRSWTLLTGSKVGVRNLAAALGVKYKQLAGGQFAHSYSISVVDSDGLVKSQLNHPGRPSGAEIQLIDKLK